MEILKIHIDLTGTQEEILKHLTNIYKDFESKNEKEMYVNSFIYQFPSPMTDIYEDVRRDFDNYRKQSQ